jgi:anti-sigma regulatory factor (Ser/Thr protein kinase)
VVELSLSLPQAVTSPGVARDWVVEELGGWAGPEDRHTVVLLLSELVTNALVHAKSELTVHLLLDSAVVRVQVDDDSQDAPLRRPPGVDRPGGRGLHLLDELASRWGVETTPTGKGVWFEVADSAGS